jgi:hypothetical protein
MLYPTTVRKEFSFMKLRIQAILESLIAGMLLEVLHWLTGGR